jgi:transposase-like protein
MTGLKGGAETISTL